jgi:AcrR family transcriptional regulator
VHADAPSDGRATRWRQHRLDRRAEFVDAALRALAKNGPDASMADIAAEAGAAKPKLYRHFADRAALLDAVAERIAAILRERLSLALDPHARVTDLILGGLHAYLDLVDEYPEAFRLLINSGPVVVQGRRIAGALGSLFADLLRTLDLDTETAEPGGAVLAGALCAATLWWLESGRAMTKQALIDYLATVVWGATDAILRKAGVTINPDQPIE